MSISGRTVVVTGGFGALGRTVAAKAAEQGARVAALDYAPTPPAGLSVTLAIGGLDLGPVADVDLGVGEAVEVGALDAVVVGGLGPRAPDVHRRAALQEGVGDAVADAAGAADHQDGLLAEIEFVHPYRPMKTGSRFSRKLATPSS